MLEILKTISAHSLRILHIEYPPVFKRPLALIPVPFPLLAELRISGPLKDLGLAGSAIAPVLERLYIRHYISLPKALGSELQRVCPHLKYLRIRARAHPPRTNPLLHFAYRYTSLRTPFSDILNTNVFAAGIPGAVNRFSTHDDDIVDDTLSPLTLRRIVVEFSPIVIADGVVDEAVFMIHAEHVTAYRRLGYLAKSVGGIQEAEDPRSPNAKTLVIYSSPQCISQEQAIKQYDEEATQADREWMESSVGSGSGCWI